MVGKSAFISESDGEEALLARADRAVESLSQNYQSIIQRQFRDLSWCMAQQLWTEAAHIAHSIGGEAGTFNRHCMGQAAILLRDLLQSPGLDAEDPAIKVMQDGLSLFVNTDVETRSEEADTLLQGLRAVAVKFGLGVSA